MIELIKGDCLNKMLRIEDESIDAIITDPPYGTTACKWDSVIPFTPMWEQLNRIIKPNGAIVLFGSEPFSSALRMSNIKNYKYDWIWQKNRATGFLQSKYMPMKSHENISVFGLNKVNYYPQKTSGHKPTSAAVGYGHSPTFGKCKPRNYKGGDTTRFPKTIQGFDCERGLHPTQKPVALMEYFILTYTNKGDTVLDFTFGSCTTGVACVKTDRNFIGIEKDEKHFTTG